MSWADYGFNGLDVTFSLVNKTWMACLMATKERIDIIGQSNTQLTRMVDNGYYKIRFPLWHNCLNYRGDGRRYFGIAGYIREATIMYVHSIAYPKIYDMETLGTAGCNIVAATGRTCVYDPREFAYTSSDITKYYSQFIFQILHQAWILKYKAMLDLLRYPVISTEMETPVCVSKMYLYDGDRLASLDAAISTILSSSNEINYSWSNYAYHSQNLFLATKTRNGTYRIDCLLKKAYVEASYVDNAIQETGDPTSDYYVRYRINFRDTDRNPTNVYFEYEFMARVDRSHYVYVDYIGEDCYELELEFDTQGLIDLITEKIDDPTHETYELICGASVSGAISRIYDGVNYFQFLDT